MIILNISETVRKEGREGGGKAGRQGNGRQRGGRIRKKERYINTYIAASVPEVTLTY